jgi:hypothetical protein
MDLVTKIDTGVYELVHPSEIHERKCHTNPRFLPAVSTGAYIALKYRTIIILKIMIMISDGIRSLSHLETLFLTEAYADIRARGSYPFSVQRHVFPEGAAPSLKLMEGGEHNHG